GNRVEPAEAATHRHHAGGARTITIGWVGDITPGSQYGLPADGGAALFADVGDTLRAPDLMAGNPQGPPSIRGPSEGARRARGPPDCYACQAPPGNARALAGAGLDVVNLANNHAFDYGEAGRTQTLGALTAAKVAFTGLPGDVRVLTRRGVRVAFVGFSTYRWT